MKRKERGKVDKKHLRKYKGGSQLLLCGFLCKNCTHLVSIYALLLRFMIFCLNLRASVAIFASLSQFTHFCRGARESAIYAFGSQKKL